MTDVKEMSREELMDHMFALINERDYNKTLIQEHDTGHIIDYVSRLEDRIEELKECLKK